MTIEEAEAHIGDGVVYAPAYGEREDGVITSVTRTHVFVMYAGDLHSKATSPGDLFLLAAALAPTNGDTTP